MNPLALSVALTLRALATEAAPKNPPKSLTLQGPPTVASLRTAFTEAVEDASKAVVLAELARIPPRTPGDLQALFDLFLRFPDDRVREAVLQSLELAAPNSPALEPIVQRYLEDPEDPAAVLLAIKAAVRLGVREALPTLRRIGGKKFAHKSADESPALNERNAWWVQYEALAALARLDPKKSLPLLIEKSRESPHVARLLGMFLWNESLPTLAEWAGGGEDHAARAKEGLEAPTPLPALRAGRAAMLRRLRDKAAPKLLRHQLALKIGLSSEAGEVAALLAERQAEKDEFTRTLLAAAIFASRDPQAIPLLVEFLKTSPDPNVRAGALVQLHDMLPKEQFRPHLEWAAKNEPDPEYRKDFERQLAELK